MKTSGQNTVEICITNKFLRTTSYAWEALKSDTDWLTEPTKKDVKVLLISSWLWWAVKTARNFKKRPFDTDWRIDGQNYLHKESLQLNSVKQEWTEGQKDETDNEWAPTGFHIKWLAYSLFAFSKS